jgi:hypothetical protein
MTFAPESLFALEAHEFLLGALPDGRFVVSRTGASGTDLLATSASGSRELLQHLSKRRPDSPMQVMAGETLFWQRSAAGDESSCTLMAAGANGVRAVLAAKPSAIPCGAAVRCDATSRRCAVAEKLTGSTSFSEVDLVTGTSKVLYPAKKGVLDWAISPDGNTVAIVAIGELEITIVDVADGQSHELRLKDAGRPEFVSFAPDSKHLIVAVNGLGEPGASGVAITDLVGHGGVVWRAPGDVWIASVNALANDQLLLATVNYSSEMETLVPERQAQ